MDKEKNDSLVGKRGPIKNKGDQVMRKFIPLALVGLVMVFTSCQRTSTQFWEDVKTAGRYINRSIDSVCGKGEYNSQLLAANDEFIGPRDAEFIPLNEKDLKAQYRTTDMAVPQPKHSPGEKGSGLPSMEKFSAPTGSLSSLFSNLYFATDEHVLRNRSDIDGIRSMAAYMKKHPNAYLTIEGHCDERASAAYNMALGTRRANHVRVMLIKEGIDFNRLYTISYGKEKPLALGHSAVDWKQNRRVQFKIYEKK